MLGPRSANPGIRDQLLALCRHSGLEPHLGPELHNLQEALATIATGAAWTLLTTNNAPRHTPGVAVRQLAEPHGRIDVTLAWRATGASQLAHTFVELAIRARDQGELAPASQHPAANQPEQSRATNALLG